MGTMIVQHGDVVGFKADKGKMEISIRMEGFGICEFPLLLLHYPLLFS